MIAGYDQFVQNIPFYGFAVLCIDHPAVQQMIPRLSDRRIITYGFSPQADIRADKLVTRQARRDLRSHLHRPRAQPLAAHGAVPAADARAAQRAERARRHRHRHRDGDRRRRRSAARSPSFRGVKRRFTKTGEVRRHHRDRRLRPPSRRDRRRAEAPHGQAGARDVVAIVQPHRYTRLQSLFRRVLHLHERCRHGHRRGRLFRRREADPRRQPRCPRRRPARERPSQRRAAARPGASRRNGPRDRASPATSSSASARATSRNGPRRCPPILPDCRASRAGNAA